jgi:hypothetical protein
VGTRIAFCVVFHSGWSSLSKDSSASLYSSLFQSISHRLLEAVDLGLQGVFPRDLPWILAVRWGRGSARGPRLGARNDLALFSDVAARVRVECRAL